MSGSIQLKEIKFKFKYLIKFGTNTQPLIRYGHIFVNEQNFPERKEQILKRKNKKEGFNMVTLMKDI